MGYKTKSNRLVLPLSQLPEGFLPKRGRSSAFFILMLRLSCRQSCQKVEAPSFHPTPTDRRHHLEHSTPWLSCPGSLVVPRQERKAEQKCPSPPLLSFPKTSPGTQLLKWGNHPERNVLSSPAPVPEPWDSIILLG